MTLSKSLRTGQRYDRKRLAKMGDLGFAEIAETAERQNVVSWIFRTKREWLVAGGRKSHWVDRDECRLFFELASKSRTGPGHVRVFALTLDCEIVTAGIALATPKM